MMSRLISHQIRSLLRHHRTSPALKTSHTNFSDQVLASDILIDEEQNVDYDAKQFCAVYPGLLVQDRYEMLVKLGWGRHSTVWLARDIDRWLWQSKRYVTIKVNVSNHGDPAQAEHELMISQRLEAKTSHQGRLFVRAPLDNFILPNPDGSGHLCSVYESMREPLSLYQRRWEDHKLPPSILKVYLKFLLQGLDYLHSRCHVIHTDLKQDNILMGFEDPEVLTDFVQQQAENPMPWKMIDGHPVYRAQYDFGRLRSFLNVPKIADFGLAECGDGPDILRHPIQPPMYHAPEVILGTGWTYSVDIWNLGVLIWDLMENRDLFRRIRSSDNTYNSRAHVAEMIALLGPPPKEISAREKQWSSIEWSWPVLNPEGKLCRTAAEYFNGPFFSQDGDFLYSDLIPGNFTLAGSITSIDGEGKDLFLDFVGNMLQWLPEKRKTAAELLVHPWLAS